MTEQELQQMIDSQVEAAVKATQPAQEPPAEQPETPAEQQPETAPDPTFSQAQIDEAVNQAIKATAARFETQLREARRPVQGAPIVKRQGEPRPLAWAVKAALHNPTGTVVLKDHDNGVAFRAGDGSPAAAKAFAEYAKAVGLDVEGIADGYTALYFDKDKYAAKAMVTTTSSAIGEHFVPRMQTRPVIEALYQQVVSRSLPGVDIYPMPGLICDAPSISTFTAGWSAENAIATAAGDATTGRKTLTAKNLTAWGELSNQLLADSNPDIERYVRDGLAGAMGEAHDTGAFVGGGANQPTGLLSESGPTSTAMSTDNFYVAVMKAVGRMMANKIPYQNICVICRPEVITKAVQAQVGSSGEYITTGTPQQPWAGAASFGDPVARRLGLPVFVTTVLTVASATSSILVLHAPSWTIGDRQELEIASSNVAGDSFKYNLTYIRAIMRVDFNLKRSTALEIITGAAHT